MVHHIRHTFRQTDDDRQVIFAFPFSKYRIFPRCTAGAVSSKLIHSFIRLKLGFSLQTILSHATMFS